MFIDIHSHTILPKPNTIYNVILGRDNLPFENWFSLGIHPWYITDPNKQVTELGLELNRLNKNLIFIGECGLDKLKGAEFSIQEQVFKTQIALSEKHKKPLIIHCVKAYNELIALKKEINPKQPWIIHGFNRKVTIAEALINNGFYLSFGLSFLYSENGKEALKNTPLNKVFFETDDNSSSIIEEVYILASEILKIELEQLKAQIKNNLWQVTGWKEQNY